LKTSDFWYELPPEYIAQTPIEPRDSSKLMVIDRAGGKILEHTHFNKIDRFIRAGDLLVLNETRVIPGRVFGKKIPSGGRVELLFLREIEHKVWECLVGGRGIIPGKRIQLEDEATAEIIDDLGGPRRSIKFDKDPNIFLNHLGKMPLPPYIHKKLEEQERYQTVYAKDIGSAAAPTAGLHFTEALIHRMQNQGVNFGSVVLHVGLDTFAPVTEENPEDHEIHSEWCQISAKTADLINSTKRNGNRVFAVGTTSVRVLETSGSQISEKTDFAISYSGYTNLFILPGYSFKVIDGLITNFHLPNSTLIMLVSAFMGREEVLNIYSEAMEENYRFYSFGDAMLVF